MPAGRPTVYKKEYNEQAYKLCLLGAKDTQIAEFFGICEKTLNNWKEKHPKFVQSLKKGKQIADMQVAEALYHRACGYSHPEDKVFNNGGEAMVVKTTKHHPPDTAAAFIWLKNRAGWNNAPQVSNNESLPEIHIHKHYDKPEE